MDDETCGELPSGGEAYIVGGGVPEDVVKRICRGDVPGSLSDHDRQLDLIVGQVFVHWLHNFGYVDGRGRANDGQSRLVEEDGVPVLSSASAITQKMRSRTSA